MIVSDGFGAFILGSQAACIFWTTLNPIEVATISILVSIVTHTYTNTGILFYGYTADLHDINMRSEIDKM